MCELLGMSANVPTDICFSFAGLMNRGGRTGPHRDGWGIAFYEGKGCRTFHDPTPSSESKLAALVRAYPIKSHVVISHIRRANRGCVALENTHPFTRELWGRVWSFAHNGQLKGNKKMPLGFYRPVGATDSEHAFCWLLGRIREAFPEPPKRRMAAVSTLVKALAAELGGMGVFNMLLSDGQHLWCHCATNLAWITRRSPFGAATLLDEDMTVDFEKETTASDVVSVIATRPLTKDEPWTVMKSGEMAVFRKGVKIG